MRKKSKLKPRRVVLPPMIKLPAIKPKRKPRRVVLGVGHPWFLHYPESPTRSIVCLSSVPNGIADVEVEFGDLGNWNRIRLVAEVLK